MTVAEIQKYIDKRENEIKKDYETRNDFNNYDRLMHYISLVANIKSMLDELEPMTNKDYMEYKGYNGVTPKDYDENAPINLQDIEVIDLLKEIKH